MKYIVMECPICKKRFSSEYWTGGYIDHAENFAGNLIRRYKDDYNGFDEEAVNDIVEDIYMDGNEIREKSDIKCRLNCFLKANFIPLEVREEVKKMVLPEIGRREAVIKKFTSVIKKFVSSLTDEELDVFQRFLEEDNHGTYHNAQDELETITEDECSKREERQGN